MDPTICLNATEFLSLRQVGRWLHWLLNHEHKTVPLHMHHHFTQTELSSTTKSCSCNCLWPHLYSQIRYYQWM